MINWLADHEILVFIAQLVIGGLLLAILNYYMGKTEGEKND